MNIDRDMQSRILNQLKDVYPGIKSKSDFTDYTNVDFNGNIQYLYEHGLIGGHASQKFGQPLKLTSITITAKGLDFLEDDGGLGAILGTVTIRFEKDTLRQLLDSKFSTAALPPEKKSAFREALAKISDEGLKTAVKRMTEHAISNIPEMLDFLGRLITPGAS